MRRGFGALFGLATGLALGAVSASAEPFRCPRVGGNLTFGQEANINTLDQMTSPTISTRNIAMNIYESLMTRDENNHPILELAEAMNEAPTTGAAAAQLTMASLGPRRRSRKVAAVEDEA